MSLSDIANSAAKNAHLKLVQVPLVERIQGVFEQPGFTAIRNHLKKSGFKEKSWSENVPGLVYSVIQFQRHGVSCEVRGHSHDNREPQLYFSRLDTARDPNQAPSLVPLKELADAYPLIERFLIDNLPEIRRPWGLMERIIGYSF